MNAHARRKETGSAITGVLLVAALLMLMVSTLLLEVSSASRMAIRRRSSIRAFQAAEAGLEAGKLAFEKTNNLFGIPTVTGTLPDASFSVRPGVGNFGNESWPMWGFDPRASRFNPTADVGDSPRIGWRTEFSPARNGVMSGGRFWGNNIYAVVANRLAYVSYENPVTNRIAVAAFSAMDGSLKWTTDTGNLLGNGLEISAMATIPEASILTFTYLSANDPNGTVRLMALNVSQSTVSVRWNFDTGMHGLGSAPAIYNPDPNSGGEEILYFTVAEAPDWQVTDMNAGRSYPESGDRAESVRLFAVRDGGQNTPIAKWAHPFPDPDVTAWTDYPTEKWTVPSGVIDRPEDVPARPPSEDLLADYYNSDGGAQMQVQGDLYMFFDPQSLSPPVLQVDDNGTPTNTADDHMHIYIYYTGITDKDIDDTDYYQSYTTPPSAGNEHLHWQAELAAVYDTPSARFPRFQWTYNPPAYDTNRLDGIPWNGYGEENWETFFEQTAAPMVTRQTMDPNGVAYASPRTVVYMPYESLEWASPSAEDNSSDAEKSRAMLMSLVDRYDDFMAGASTTLYDEYWVNAEGPNPYNWNEDDPTTVGDLPNATLYPGITRSMDLDIEGESLAYDSMSNVIYFVFNHDLYPTGPSMEQFRVHALNARTGQGRGVSGGAITHLWDYINVSEWGGDRQNSTPALAGNLLYMLNRLPSSAGRTAQLIILNSNDGSSTPNSPIVIDTDCDGANLAASVANDAIYVGTYDDLDNIQRVYALSPSVWLLSTGISSDGRARRTLALRQEGSILVEWREGGFSGGP